MRTIARPFGWPVTLSADLRWPKTYLLPRPIAGYDSMRITLTFGVLWLGAAIFIRRLCDRNGCTHVPG